MRTRWHNGVAASWGRCWKRGERSTEFGFLVSFSLIGKERTRMRRYGLLFNKTSGAAKEQSRALGWCEPLVAQTDQPATGLLQEEGTKRRSRKLSCRSEVLRFLTIKSLTKTQRTLGTSYTLAKITCWCSCSWVSSGKGQLLVVWKYCWELYR